MVSIKVLAFAGKTHSGKTKSADLILQLDPRFTRRSFADVLRTEFAMDSKTPFQKLVAPDTKENYRLNLIAYAEEKKKQDRSYFAKKLFEHRRPGELTLIDDLRFIEELQLCLINGAAIYKIHADNLLRKARGWRPSPDIDEDYSETELDLSADTFRTMCDGHGGIVFNTRDDPYLIMQLKGILEKSFPQEAAVGERFRELMTPKNIEF